MDGELNNDAECAASRLGRWIRERTGALILHAHCLRAKSGQLAAIFN